MLLAWPRAGGDWGKHLPTVRNTLARAAAALLDAQRVVIIAADAESEASIRGHPTLTDAADKLRVVCQPADDIWFRDYGPLTVTNGRSRLFLDYRFDGWRQRYPAARDDRITAALVKAGALGSGSYQRRDYVLEGGAIDGNGAGALLATRNSLITAARNPGDSQSCWERRFRDDLGVERVHWLDYGHLEGDDTDGHIDTLARFVAPDAIVHQSCDDPADPHYAGLAAMAEQLAGFRDIDGAPYSLHPLPWPRPQYDGDRRLPLGYGNFLVGNATVLVPQYDDPADAAALTAIAACFPGREAVGIDCRALIRQNGALHCAAMQIPALPKYA